jgi:hypothetical protein
MLAATLLLTHTAEGMYLHASTKVTRLKESRASVLDAGLHPVEDPPAEVLHSGSTLFSGRSTGLVRARRPIRPQGILPS